MWKKKKRGEKNGYKGGVDVDHTAGQQPRLNKTPFYIFYI
jgi:hypothetical protein